MTRYDDLRKQREAQYLAHEPDPILQRLSTLETKLAQLEKSLEHTMAAVVTLQTVTFPVTHNVTPVTSRNAPPRNVTRRNAVTPRNTRNAERQRRYRAKKAEHYKQTLTNLGLDTTSFNKRPTH